MNWLSYWDRWLCVHLPFHRLRIWWQELWIRNDEFHVSYNLDANAIVLMESSGNKSTYDFSFGFGHVTERTARYLSHLNRRRQIAHQRTL